MNQSVTLSKRAKICMPGGVNSPVRSFNSVDCDPLFFARGEGAYLFDVDGKRYIDYVGSWGPLILGHAHPKVLEAFKTVANNGLSFGACTEIEVTMAEFLCQHIPSLQQVRMVNSGTEATMTAIRLARGKTGRNKFIKFDGGYHGHSDALLVKGGSGQLTMGQPSSAGVPAHVTEDTLVATYNDLSSVAALFEEYPHDIAAIIVEGVAGNMNCIPPTADFLPGLRALCDKHQAIFIMDEVMSGFRMSPGTAQQRYNVIPDLTTLGKIIGGGMPVGALGGKTELMQQLAPTGPVYQAGTLSGNPVAMAAGLTTLQCIFEEEDFYENLEECTSYLLSNMQEIADKHQVPFTYNQAGSMFGMFFSDEDEITHFEQVKNANQDLFKAFYKGMLKEGVYFAPSAFEAGFISNQHNQEILDKTLEAFDTVLQEVGSRL